MMVSWWAGHLKQARHGQDPHVKAHARLGEQPLWARCSSGHSAVAEWNTPAMEFAKGRKSKRSKSFAPQVFSKCLKDTLFTSESSRTSWRASRKAQKLAKVQKFAKVEKSTGPPPLSQPVQHFAETQRPKKKTTFPLSAPWPGLPQPLMKPCSLSREARDWLAIACSALRLLRTAYHHVRHQTATNTSNRRSFTGGQTVEAETPRPRDWHPDSEPRLFSAALAPTSSN